MLAAIRRAIPTHGSLLLGEKVLGRSDHSDGRVMDILMMAIGGAERTGSQWRALLGRAGFTLSGISPHHGSVSVLEAIPTLL